MISEESESEEEEQSQQSCIEGCHTLWDEYPIEEVSNKMLIDQHVKSEKEIAASSAVKTMAAS